MKFLFWEITKRKSEGFVPPRNYQQKWVSKDGREQEVKDMTESHLRNSLGMILHQLRQDKVAYIGKDDRIAFAPIIRDLVDGAELSYIANGVVNSAGVQMMSGTSKATVQCQQLQGLKTGDSITIRSSTGLGLGNALEIDVV